MAVKSGWISAVTLGILFLASQAHADCVKPEFEGEYGFTACKEWPAYPGLIITAKSQWEPGSTYGETGPDGTYDLDLAILEAGTANPLASWHRDTAFESDAIALQELTIDTARYRLTPELRAFGVRADFKGSSRVNPVAEHQLSLYVKEGQTLRPVLDRLVVYEFGGEWDGNCAGERYELSRTVEIAKTTSHGFADLTIKTQRSGITGVGEGDACEDKVSEAKPVLTTLRYDGKAYVLPNGFSGL